MQSHHQGTNPFQQAFLALAEACESADIQRIHHLAASLAIHPNAVNEAHLKALAWVEELGV